MARDATARLYDVDANLVVMDKKAGTITFQAKKGKLADLDQLHESIKATRLGDGTGMRLKWLEVTAVGEASVVDNEVRLKVTGSDQYFVLTEDAAAPMARLREALQQGEKKMRVTGRVDGWTGNLTQFSRKLPDKPRRIVVSSFEVVKP